MGPQGDVHIARIGSGKLEINSDVKLGALSIREGELNIDGVPLRTYIAKIVAMAMQGDQAGSFGVVIAPNLN